ncbi:hypothetical protein FNV43_RR23001 [Rhamnella rubrinervis]|uniref:Uncharacterized protein n=1 Tax=Rhamnella rubrinervis TaxID=2594499 RepID=A0A8K0GRN0_9ROSA|nr:hypothetical protein FNV43_RR23001 [Rhamnella rubrinervis]
MLSDKRGRSGKLYGPWLKAENSGTVTFSETPVMEQTGMELEGRQVGDQNLKRCSREGYEEEGIELQIGKRKVSEFCHETRKDLTLGGLSGKGSVRFSSDWKSMGKANFKSDSLELSKRAEVDLDNSTWASILKCLAQAQIKVREDMGLEFSGLSLKSGGGVKKGTPLIMSEVTTEAHDTNVGLENNQDQSPRGTHTNQRTTMIECGSLEESVEGLIIRDEEEAIEHTIIEERGREETPRKSIIMAEVVNEQRGSPVVFQARRNDSDGQQSYKRYHTRASNRNWTWKKAARAKAGNVEEDQYIRGECSKGNVRDGEALERDFP